MYQRPAADLSRRLQVRFYRANLSAAGQAEATGWPDLQISATSFQWLALIARKRQMAVSSKQKQPDGQTSRFQPQVVTSLLSRTINVSAAGPSYFQQKPGQWPFYQGLALVARKRQIAVSSRQKQADCQTCRFQKQIAISLLSRTSNLTAAGPSYFQAKAGPTAVLSTPGPMAVLLMGKRFAAKACPMAVLST